MKIVDAKGKLCPLPLIMTKKALSEIKENETLKVIIDNDISVQNIRRFVEEHGMKVQVNKNNNIYEILINKTGHIPDETKPEDYCPVGENKLSDFVVSVQRNRLGDGPEELGYILIKAFINTLPESELKPKTIIFMNSGILLTLKDSPVIDALKKLEQTGVDILVCGTCLDFYKKKEELGTGIISNMYEITERLSKAGNIIYP